jgi:PAS domain S-box-containing protein
LTRIKQQSGNACELIPEKCVEPTITRKAGGLDSTAIGGKRQGREVPQSLRVEPGAKLPVWKTQSLDHNSNRWIPAPCWQKKECDQVNCPAFNRSDLRCWRLLNTLCGGERQPNIIDRWHQCLICPVFEAHAEAAPGGWKQFLSEEVIHFLKNETHGAKLKNDSSLAEILDNLTHGLLIVDEKRRINYFNTAAEQITGLSTDDVKGRACEDVFASTNSEADDRLQKVIQAGENILNQEGTITRINGRAVPIICSTLALKNQHGRVIGGMEIFKDISVRKGLEADLKRTENKYHRIFEGSKDMIFITSRDGKIKDVNQAGIDLMGYTDKQEVLSLASVENLYSNRRHWRVFQKQIDLYGYVKDFEARFKKKDGILIHCLLSGNAVRSNDGTKASLKISPPAWTPFASCSNGTRSCCF